MKMISTFAHGIGDYLGAIALFFAPQIFGFYDVGGAAVLVPRILAVLIFVQALLTNYELGAIRVVPMRMHLAADYVAGLFLAASPWMFGFHDQRPAAWMPHLLVGLGVFAFTMMTESEPTPEFTERPMVCSA